MPKESFLKNRIRSVGFALKGMFLLLRTEASIKVQFVIALLVTGAGFYFNISNTEWIIQLLAIGMVMGMEGANTAIEKIADYIQPNIDPKIGFIKDISAGAVMIVSIIAAIVGLIIYVPKLI
ncbi:diacylglycerol kinase family protein [Flagellimonas sp. 389]|uniref:diacylglycerol kinase family protein n=1 Tax=Flagellimonas sp. 389 TaxID=2835862 RepID=UPI001BD6B2A0|nr:diacylglycerol kinase family protein [Flagellimonas sp. 389]MBS9463019.1 diacylglycerol kinase family protein [Flagellimonas sp. 389]